MGLLGIFTKNKPIDCYKKVNKLINKMYYIKKTLILKADSINDSDRENIRSQVNDAINIYNKIISMDFSSTYFMMKNDIIEGSSVVDYESKRMSISELLRKVCKEFEVIKRIVKGAPVVMSEVNIDSIPKDYFYDEHKLGVYHTAFINDPRYELPPMFIV